MNDDIGQGPDAGLGAAGSAGEIDLGGVGRIGQRARALAGLSLGVTCGLLVMFDMQPSNVSHGDVCVPSPTVNCGGQAPKPEPGPVVWHATQLTPIAPPQYRV